LNSKLTPLARFRKGSIELVMDEKLRRPLLKVGGKSAEEAYAILAERFLTREGEECSEVILPLTSFPAVSAWLLASYGSKPSRELLDELLCSTPKVVADLVCDLIELSENLYEDWEGKPLINRRIALKASKIVRLLLELYKSKR